MRTHLTAADDQVVEAEASTFTVDDIEALHAWNQPGLLPTRFDWWLTETKVTDKEAQGARYVKVVADGAVQGMATFTPFAVDLEGHPHLYIGVLETAPWNRGANPRFKGMMRAVIEAAITESMRLGHGGMIGLSASAREPVGRYERLGMVRVDELTNYMLMSPDAADRFLSEMEAQRG